MKRQLLNMKYPNKFKIHSLKLNPCRQWDNNGFFKVSIVFSVDEFYKNQFVKLTEDYPETTVVEDPEKAKEYISGLVFSENEKGYCEIKNPEIDRDTVFKKAYRADTQRILTYLEKFNAFVYRKFITVCPVTLAAFETLRALNNDYSYSFEHNHLMLITIKTLDLHWD